MPEDAAWVGNETNANWRVDAACGDADPELFFPVKEQLGRQAKQYCHACPVRLECLTEAMEHPEISGVWGGLTAEERSRLRIRFGARALQEASRAVARER